MTGRSFALASALTLGLPVANGCNDDVLLGVDQPSTPTAGSAGVAGAGAGSAGTAGANEAGSGPTLPCSVASCQGRTYACGDCVDNDGDGAIDADDSQCLGPCDDTEDSFYVGIPGGNGGGCRQDCYFDRNSGAGNDGCSYSLSCDPLSLAPEYPPSGDAACAYDDTGVVPGTGATCAELRATQADTCLETCLPLTPNGCDCFGCCELPARSGMFVWVGSGRDSGGTCTEEVLDDPTACRPCTPVPSCFNACDACEVCAGNMPPASSCAPDSEQCDVGRQACGPTQPCAPDSYCITGCCVPEPR